MTTTDEAWSAVAEVDGWMTRGQSDELFEAASACPDGGRIVEIGSFHGRSTIVLALAAPQGVQVIAIDPHAGTDRGPGEISGFKPEAEIDHDVFLTNLSVAGVADRVTHLRMTSHAALNVVRGSVDVLYIDGSHRYGLARSDIRNWGDKVSDGGTMLLHDSFSAVGVTLATCRELLLSKRLRYLRRSRSLAVYVAEMQRASVLNIARQLLQVPYFAKNVATKILLKGGLGRAFAAIGRTPPEWPY
jgi:hypothetical protein